MSSPRYTLEFRDEAVRQVTERNYPAKEVAECLGMEQGAPAGRASAIALLGQFYTTDDLVDGGNSAS